VHGPYADKLALAGAAMLAFLALRFAFCALYGFYRFFLRPGSNMRRYGQWAVVTGATDGIGKAYAYELAKRGMNVFLLSRTQSKLDEVASEIGSKFKVKTQVMAIDFSKFHRNSPNLEK